jgi:AcrR family transcriptional regulator
MVQKRVGRKKAFDPDSALDAAMETFWAKGFDGTSLDDLTRTMGINRPSLYATFGCKRTLFDMALERYGNTIGSEPLKGLLEEDNIHAAVRAFLSLAVKLQTREGKAQGCFVTNCGFVTGEPNSCLQDKLAENQTTVHKLIVERFDRAKADGQLPATFDSESRAMILMDFMSAQAVRARAGEERCSLMGALEERARLVLA